MSICSSSTSACLNAFDGNRNDKIPVINCARVCVCVRCVQQWSLIAFPSFLVTFHANRISIEMTNDDGVVVRAAHIRFRSTHQNASTHGYVIVFGNCLCLTPHKIFNIKMHVGRRMQFLRKPDYLIVFRRTIAYDWPCRSVHRIGKFDYNYYRQFVNRINWICSVRFIRVLQHQRFKSCHRYGFNAQTKKKKVNTRSKVNRRRNGGVNG